MKAHELLNTPEKWTKGAFAKDHTGCNVNYNSALAICFCLGGAINRCYNNPEDVFVNANKIGKFLNLPNLKLTEWNDAPERTYEEVITILKELDI